MDKYAQLESINSLKEKGALTEVEYQTEKKKILGDKEELTSNSGHQDLNKNDFILNKLIPNRLNQKKYIKFIFFYIPIVWFLVMIALGIIVGILYKIGIIELGVYQGSNISSKIGFLLGSYLNIPSLIVAIGFYLILSISRFHDIGKSGWHILIPIYGIIIPLIKPGIKEDNRYGSASE